MKTITHVEVRMYRMGTGDCFALKFFADAVVQYKMMIDCGTWSGSTAVLKPFIDDLLKYLDHEVDVLVVTHEHKDHVYGFEACEALFKEAFVAKQVWMGWTEDDSANKVKTWKKAHGDKKQALALAAERLRQVVNDPGHQSRLAAEADGRAMVGAQKGFSDVLSALAELHVGLGATGNYVGPLAGMKVVKESIAKKARKDRPIRYCRPGEIIGSLPEIPGIKFYVLGPPLSWDEVKLEGGGAGESYGHNMRLAQSDAFAAALVGESAGTPADAATPFDGTFELTSTSLPRSRYDDAASEWRRIDHDWLYSAGSLALRLNSLTNNLSLALAIEFEKSGKIMLFPGDAEYGSWKSWHAIDWKASDRRGKKLTTKDILGRTVFYKVAHHLSNNGTAMRLGLEMMPEGDLTAMATLDYDVISSGWKSTMPNGEIVTELLKRTKGRLMIMNEDGLTIGKDKTPVSTLIKTAQVELGTKEKAAFEKDHHVDDLYLQYTVRA